MMVVSARDQVLVGFIVIGSIEAVELCTVTFVDAFVMDIVRGSFM